MAVRVVDEALAEASASERARVVATLIKLTGDWELAEDCAQDAFAKAVTEWAAKGVPTNPGAWLTTVAKNRAIDRLRRSATETRVVAELAVLESLTEVDVHELDDDRLRLIFTCCHPALAMEARVALTLRTVAGLTTAEIARAFLVTESTMTKRLVRARAKIKAAAIPYRVPPAHLLPERATGVFAVLYLLFNEGYSASAGETLVRAPLTREAIRLTRLVVALLGDDPLASEGLGLLALMLFHQAREQSRTDATGDIVTLEHQDRTLWNPDLIAEGRAALAEATRRRAKPGVYLQQAAIAQCHVVAPSAEATDFGRVARLYEALGVVSPSPVVELNRAVAVAMSQGPEAGLEIIDGLAASGVLDGYYLLPAARADLLRRLGRRTEAAVEYRAALGLAPSEVEQRYLQRRLAESTR